MNLTDEQKYQLHLLLEYRDQIVNNLFQIEHILKIYFPEEFDIAYQHWIPQIMTALYNDTRWLSRGERNMQQTIVRLLDKSQNLDKESIKKYLR